MTTPQPTDRTDDRLLRIADVRARTGLSTATIYRRVGQGTFPPKIPMGPRTVGWYASEVGKWLSDPSGYRQPGYAH